MQQAALDGQLRALEDAARRLRDAHAAQLGDVRYRALRNLPPAAQADARVLRAVGEFHTYARALQAELERHSASVAKLELALAVRRDTNGNLRDALAAAQAKAAAAEADRDRLAKQLQLLQSGGGGGGEVYPGGVTRAAALESAMRQQLTLIEELRLDAEAARVAKATAEAAAAHWQSVAAVRGAMISKLQAAAADTAASSHRAAVAPAATASRRLGGSGKHLPSPGRGYELSPTTPVDAAAAAASPARYGGFSPEHELPSALHASPLPAGSPTAAPRPGRDDSASASSSTVGTPEPTAAAAADGDVWGALAGELDRLTEHVASHQRLVATLSPS